MSLFEKTRDFVSKSFGSESRMVHFDRTVYWLKQLKPETDEALLVAAIGHDIERAKRDQNIVSETIKAEKGFLDSSINRHHQDKGAQILGDFLLHFGADGQFVERVKHLVSRHEEGGDDDQNLLKDADSLSFLENNSQIFLDRYDSLGYDKIKEKFDWMYSRITSPKAKEIAKPYYEKIIIKLNDLAIKK